jgi:hypothetical protein
MVYDSFEKFWCDFSDLKGKFIKWASFDKDRVKFCCSTNVIDEEDDSLENLFYFIMEHSQNCCECVYLDEESIKDEDESVLNYAIVLETEKISELKDEGWLQYTYYKIRTDKGYFSFHFRGEGDSNYYTLDVDCIIECRPSEFNIDDIVKGEVRK